MRGLHFVAGTRLHQTRSWAVSDHAVASHARARERAIFTGRGDGVGLLRRRRDSCAGFFVEFEAVPRRYSLQWFQALFVAAISKAEKAETLEARLDVLNTFFTYYVYVNVCRR